MSLSANALSRGWHSIWWSIHEPVGWGRGDDVAEFVEPDPPSAKTSRQLALADGDAPCRRAAARPNDKE
jgi:hypothetical protein